MSANMHPQDLEDFLTLFIRDAGVESYPDTLDGEDLIVRNSKGEPVYKLNPRLVMQQCLTVNDLRQIKSLHAEKLDYFDKMKLTDDKNELKLLAKEVTRIEYAMQRAWHFTEDSHFHKWNKVPKCICSHVIDKSCPVHGD